uniref:Uncharacterized protein n=1 Tax=Romanomermis culicivorax TaxID=13658 RepID=A0A915JLQ0_ROMCU
MISIRYNTSSAAAVSHIPGRLPFLLFETGATDATLVAAGVVLAATKQAARAQGIQNVAGFGVTVANASAAHFDFFDCVEVLNRNKKI